MQTLTLRPGEQGGILAVEAGAEPESPGDELLVAGVAVGVCGTDRGLVARGPRRLPDGDGLVIGHEALGRVRSAPPDSPFAPGDLVAGLVRRADPVPCRNCAAGDLDLCLNGRFTERGIAGQDGYGAERYLLEPSHAVAVDARLGLTGVLVEPTSIVAKAWERLDAVVRRPGTRALILGAGPIGLLAALLAHQRGYDVHVVDQVRSGPKVDQVEALGAVYHRGAADLRGDFDAVVECTGELVATAIEAAAPGGAVCLVAGSHRGGAPTLELAKLGGALTGGNRAITGVSSSARRHFEAARTALEQASPAWLGGLLTGICPLADYAAAFAAGPDTIKSVILLGEDTDPGS